VIRADAVERLRIGLSALAEWRQARYALCREISGGLVQLSISNRTVNGVAVVDCDGRLVFGEESASLRDAVRSLLLMNKEIVLNLGGVSYIDSGGLGTLVALYTTAQNSGGAIRLASLTKRVGDLLQVTKLVTVFEVHETVEQAVNSFKKGVAA